MKTITIIGSGLAGTLLTLYLARRGYKIELYESREDMRAHDMISGRSINLALSCRGITGLERLGLMAEVEKIMVPMRARAIHLPNGEIKYQAFGRHHEEYINAILRGELNKLLLNKAEEEAEVNLYFEKKLIGIDVGQKKLEFLANDGSVFTRDYELLIGADGVSSLVRNALVDEKIISATRQFLPHGYKELSIAKEHRQGFLPEHLHLWPRESFMLLGNPNCDDSITGTLFLPQEGKNSFADLNNDDSIRLFFKEKFYDAYQAMPHLIEEFARHPVGNLSTVKCAPWYFEDQCLIIGDAAHGLVPFFGQGMNSAFEDIRVLNEFLDHYHDDWRQVLPAFYASRKPNTDAVAAMSMDNYHEIQKDISDKRFLLRKQTEQELMQKYPNRYISKHVLVMFTNTPYVKAKAYGEVQNDLLEHVCAKIQCTKEINWSHVDKLMDQYDKKLAKINTLYETN